MRFTLKNKLYDLQTIKKIIPVSLTQIVRCFRNEPSEHFYLFSNCLNGEIALVTGGYKGIGLSIASILLRNGAKVIITGRNESELKVVCESFSNPNISFMKWDISETENVASYYSIAESIFGKISILVNNAGVTTNGKRRLSFADMDDEHIHYVHGINTLGTRTMCTSFVNRYEKGVILNIISNTSMLPAKDAYFTSKWAIRSFTEAYAKDCQKDGKSIVVCGLCPGPVKTDMSFGANTSLYRSLIPNRRIGLPEEIAELAFRQILYAAKYGVGNGQIIICDGGEILN